MSLAEEVNKSSEFKIKNLSEMLGCSASNVYDQIRILKRHGYLKKSDDKRYGLELKPTEDGLRELIPKNLKNGSGGCQNPEYDDIEIQKMTFSKPVHITEPVDLRIKKPMKVENIWRKVAEKILKIEGVTPTSSNANDLFFKIPDSKSTTDYTVRVTTSLCSIILSRPILFRNTVSNEAKNYLIIALEDTAKEVENFFNRGFRRFRLPYRLTFLPGGELGMYLSNQEIAHLDNEFAKYFIRMGYSVRILDEKDGKPRIIVDLKSPTGPHLEFTHPLHAEDDSRRYSGFQKNVGKENISKIIEDLEGPREVEEVIKDVSTKEGLWENIKSTPKRVDDLNSIIRSSLVPSIYELSRNLRTHVKVEKKIEKGIDESNAVERRIENGIGKLNASVDKLNSLLEIIALKK